MIFGCIKGPVELGVLLFSDTAGADPGTPLTFYPLLCPSQQFFSHIRTGPPALYQY